MHIARCRQNRHWRVFLETVKGVLELPVVKTLPVAASSELVAIVAKGIMITPYAKHGHSAKDVRNQVPAGNPKGPKFLIFRSYGSKII